MSAFPIELTDKLNAIKSIKASIKSSIEKKGVTVDGSFEDYPDYIDEIETGGSDEQFAALIDNSITEVTIPDDVTNIRNNAFYECTSLTSVTMHDNITNIGIFAFEGCTSLTSVILPSRLPAQGFGRNTFERCHSLTSVRIPDGVTTIGSSTFRECRSLNSVILPDTISYIGDNAFNECYALTSIDIPSNVNIIMSSAFRNCTSLASVTIRNTNTKLTYNNYIFDNIASGAILYVPEALLSDYQNDASWSGAFSQIRQIGYVPATYEITSCDLGDGQTQAAFEAGQRTTIAVCFYGTGLTSDLDYANMIQVGTSDEGWDVTYDHFGNIIEEDQEMGTPAGVALNYNITVPDYGSQYRDEITFTCDEFEGTINVCSYKITGYEVTGDSSNGVNQYPNSMTLLTRVYFDNAGSLTDFYLNDAAQETISSSILSVTSGNAEIAVGHMGTGVGVIDEEGHGELSIEYSITPEDDGEVMLTMQWSRDMNEETYSFDAQVPVEAADFNGFAYNDNGTLVECEQPDSDLWAWPVGTDLYAVLDGLTDGANYFDGVQAWVQPLVDGEVDGDITTFTDITDVTLDGEPFKAIHISPISGDSAGDEYEVNIEIPNDTIYSGALQIVDGGGEGGL